MLRLLSMAADADVVRSWPLRASLIGRHQVENAVLDNYYLFLCTVIQPAKIHRLDYLFLGTGKGTSDFVKSAGDLSMDKGSLF